MLLSSSTSLPTLGLLVALTAGGAASNAVGRSVGERVILVDPL